MPSRPFRPWIVSAAALASLALGCREELGPERPPSASVQGVVLKSGEPIQGGWIEFQPTDGAVGDVRSAPIQPDGTFHVDRAAIGLNAVRLVDLPGLPPGAASILSNAVPIRRTIPRQPEGPIRIDVVEELLRYQNRKSP